MGQERGNQDRLVPVVPGMKQPATYKMIGFSKNDGPMFEEDVTADRA